MKILLVEDEKELRDTVKTYLEREKFVVECAEDYPTAMSKISPWGTSSRVSISQGVSP